MDKKLCVICDEEKPLSDFNDRMRHGKIEYSRMCKSCSKTHKVKNVNWDKPDQNNGRNYTDWMKENIS